MQWQNPNLIDYSSTRLLRRSDRFPMDPEDGDIIFEGDKLLFQDTGLQNSTEYFYVVFAKDKANQFSEASFANAVPEAGISTVIRVPIDFITIQEGLNAASPGDTVRVYPGTYSPATNGEVFPLVLADGVDLRSKSGRNSTIVDAKQTNLVFMGANDASIQGFTITGGWNASIKPTSTGIYSEPAGGAILCVDVMNMKIVNNKITGNVADGPFFPDGYGGGIFCFRSEVTIRENIISDNFAERDHGGISCVGDPSPPTVWIENNQILHNRGGGLGLDGIHAIVEGNLIAENIVTGAGIPIPGGIDLGTFFWGSAKIINNTIAFNYNSQLPGNISGVYFTSGNQPIELVNNIIWGHDDRGGKEIAGLGQSAKDLSVSYCDIEGGFPGTGNIPTEPLFIDPLNGNYHLQENSPCIDAGDPTFLPNSDGTRADIGAWPFFHTGTSQIHVTPDQFVVHVNQQIKQ